MQENNFEKQVQQKMDELSVSPSAEVWQTLSGKIAKDRKDRRFFVVIFLLLLFVSTTIYFIFNNPSNSQIQNSSLEGNIPAKTKSSSNPAIENKASAKVDHTNSTASPATNLSAMEGQQQPAPATTQAEKAFRADDTKVAENTSSFALSTHKSNESILKNAVADKAKRQVYNTKQRLIVTNTENMPVDLADKNFGSIDSGKVNAVAAQRTKKVASPAFDFVTKHSLSDFAETGTSISMLQPNDLFVQQVTTANKNEVVTKEKAAFRQSKPWKPGLNLSLGAATTQSGLLGIIGTGGGDAAKAFADLSQNSPGGVTPGNTIVYYPSPVKTGIGVLIGAFAEKSIGTRAAIVVGLNFKMLNSSMMTGARVDSIAFSNGNYFASGNAFYRVGSLQKFTNHFYFIEFPASLKLQLNQQKKTPVFVTAGINFARLISSNALQFDIASGSYYQDNARFNKNLLNGALSILFSLNAKSKSPLLIGPDVQYSFSKMANTGLYKSRHYSFIGITLQKAIGKK